MRISRIARYCLAALGWLGWLPAGAPCQRPLKILLLYDMEGVSGLTRTEQTHYLNPAEYAHGRKSLTSDVNAAIAGLKAGGAGEIVVVDGHASGSSEPDIHEDLLAAPARLIWRGAPFSIYMESYDRSVDAIIAVGMHAGAGNPAGFLSHTYTLEDLQYRVNGTPFNESMILALGAARLGIPLIMVSGDDVLEKEIRGALPWVKYAAVKRALSRSQAEELAPGEAAGRIEAAAREAVRSLRQARLFEFPGPYRFALTFQDEAQARNAALLRGVELLPDGITAEVRAADFEEGFRTTQQMMALARMAAEGTALQAIFGGQPQGPELRRAVRGYLVDRWLNRLPAAPAASGASQRNFGAR